MVFVAAEPPEVGGAGMRYAGGPRCALDCDRGLGAARTRGSSARLGNEGLLSGRGFRADRGQGRAFGNASSGAQIRRKIRPAVRPAVASQPVSMRTGPSSVRP